MDNVERLMEFGLTRHEASLYILLTLEGSLNGVSEGSPRSLRMV